MIFNDCRRNESIKKFVLIAKIHFFQIRLSPLIGHEDIVDEYLDAITHEVYHDNTPLGTGPLLPPGGFPGMINRFPTSYMHNMHGSAYAGFHRRVDPFAAASSKLNTIASPNQSSSPNLIPSNQAQTSGNEINVISSNGFNSNNHNNNLPGANGFSSGLVASSSNGNPNHINNHNLAPSGISLAIQPSMLNQAYKSLRRLDLKGNERT